MAEKAAPASMEERLNANPDSLAFPRVAEYFRTSGDIARAIALCDDGNRKHPDNVTGRLILGHCYRDLDNLEEAVKAYAAVCELDRRNMAAMKSLADIFLRLGARDKAGDLYALLSAMDPWNDTLTRLAAATPGSREADVLTILKEPPVDTASGPLDLPIDIPEDVVKTEPADDQHEIALETLMEPPATVTAETQDEVLDAALPPGANEIPAGAEAEIAAQMAMTQEVTRRDLGITEPEPAVEDEAVIETSESVSTVADEALFEATTVTGSDITDRMALLFGDRETVVTPVVPETPAAAPVFGAAVSADTVETVEVEPMGDVPDGNSISSRIDELFNRDTLKMPAIRETEPDETIVENAVADQMVDNVESGGADEIAAAPALADVPLSLGQADLEETMIMDAEEVKDFLRKGVVAPEEPVAEKGPGLIADALPADERTAAFSEELIVDESESVGPSAGISATPAASEGTITGDDVVRLMSGFFDGGADKAIAEVVGPESIDDFFETAEIEEEEKPAEVVAEARAAVVAPPEVKPALIADEPPTEETSLSAAEDTITGDDVAKRIDGYFGRSGAEKVADPAPLIEESDAEATIVEAAPAGLSPVPAAEAVLPTFTEESASEATIVESAPEDTATMPAIPAREPESREEATVAADAVTGDDVMERIAGIFGETESVAAVAPLEETVVPSLMDVDDTRIVDAGRPSETDVIEDTVAESASALISGADIEERIEEYFHDAADKAARGAAENPPLPARQSEDVEETVSPQFPVAPENDIDAKADYEETIISFDDTAGIGDAVETAVTGTAPVAPEMNGPAIEIVAPLEETIETEAGDREETIAAQKGEDDRESTAVFTDFSPSSAADAPAPPPVVPLFTNENVRTFDEETIIAELPGSAGGRVEPDIPDHVLTPTLADIYLQQGQPKLALTIYQRLLEKKPGSEKIEARIREIEKALAEGSLPVEPVEQKPIAVKAKKKNGPKESSRKKPVEDTRPLAGVRLKKKPKLNWKKK